MNELQISLLAVGVAVVAGVYGFNRWQERKYRRQTEAAFASEQADVLLQESGEPAYIEEHARREVAMGEGPRVEPMVLAVEEEIQLEPVEMTDPILSLTEDVPPAAVPEEYQPGIWADKAIDYVATIYAGDPLAGRAVAQAIARSATAGKPIHWLGMNPLTGEWEEINHRPNTAYGRLIASLQLADRAGPTSESELTAFCDNVQAVADELAAIAEFPDRSAALARAAELDGFCANVDVLIGINVAAADGRSFPATKIRALAEAAGMKLEADGSFYFVDDAGAELFSLGNLDPTPFSPETIRNLSTHGATLLLDVPKVSGGLQVFGQMVALAKQMAASLDAQLVDDNRKPLSDAGIDRIKQQLAEIYARMDVHLIGAGSLRAQRLFS